jgi:hypothetical protein
MRLAGIESRPERPLGELQRRKEQSRQSGPARRGFDHDHAPGRDGLIPRLVSKSRW